MVRVLFIGDIVGRPGRDLIRQGLSALVEHHRIDFVIANVENAAAGFGITRETGDQLLESGVDVMTSGNHIWDRKEAFDYIGVEPRLLRPANYPPGAPGNGSYVGRTHGGASIGVINVMGRLFMLNIDDPFASVKKEIAALKARAAVILVDFHAEATSEKLAMGWYLDGQVTCVVGTHTHVQTADERILPKGTAYLTDAGMTGPHDSIIGVQVEAALGRFLNALPAKLETATANPRLNAVVIEADEQTGRAADIERLSYSLDELVDLANDRSLRSTV
jgi:metallophosphoesterase (TIGR00282 family)